MKKKLIILGCGNSMGTPRIDGYWGNSNKKNIKNIRTRCSAIILKGNNSILIDTSPDIKSQFLSNKIKKISSILYTHEHADQTSGLFEVRPFTFCKKKFNFKSVNRINIYGNIKTINLLKSKFDYCFKKNSYYLPIVKANFVKKKFFLGKSKEKILFKTFQANHGLTKSVIYIFEKTAYISDCNDMSITKREELKNLNYLILDCLNFRKNYAHFNLKESLYIHNKLKPKKTYLINLHPDLDYDFLMTTLPKNVYPAYDGLTLKL